MYGNFEGLQFNTEERNLFRAKNQSYDGLIEVKGDLKMTMVFINFKKSLVTRLLEYWKKIAHLKSRMKTWKINTGNSERGAVRRGNSSNE